MKRFALKLFLLLAALPLIVSCGGKGKVIPKKKMSKIYAEMFIADQLIISDYGARSMADTTLVYEPILKKYGCTSADYRASVEYYMNDADRFARILRHSSVIVEQKIKELKKEKEMEESLTKMRTEAMVFRPERIFNLTGINNPDVFSLDSVRVYVDSTGGEVYFDPQIGLDTVFKGPEMIVKDTVAAGDTSAMSHLRDSLENIASDNMQPEHLKRFRLIDR